MSESEDLSQEKTLFKRLPRTVVPSHYDLKIRPFLDTFQFEGTVTIDIQVFEETDIIILYAADLKVEQATLKSNTQELIGQVVIDQPNERITIKFTEPIQKGNYKLYIPFQGEITSRMNVFIETSTHHPMAVKLDTVPAHNLNQLIVDEHFLVGMNRTSKRLSILHWLH